MLIKPVFRCPPVLPLGAVLVPPLIARDSSSSRPSSMSLLDDKLNYTCTTRTPAPMRDPALQTTRKPMSKYFKIYWTPSVVSMAMPISISGIQPIFEPLKARRFGSPWTWVQQNAPVMRYDIIATVDRDIVPFEREGSQKVRYL